MLTADLSETIDALCRGIDAGDDALLPILADALEETGDDRANSLRDNLPRPVLSTGDGRAYWIWWRQDAPCRPTQGVISVSAWYYLRSMVKWHFSAGWACYRTRSDAFLALAEALS